MSYYCPYCGEELYPADDVDKYKCPKHRNELFILVDDEIYNVDDYFRSNEDSDLDVDPEDWRDYEDGIKTSW